MIRKVDQFGHKVNFNFDKDGETHRTTIGGILSTFYIVGMIIYTGTCITSMIQRTLS